MTTRSKAAVPLSRRNFLAAVSVFAAGSLLRSTRAACVTQAQEVVGPLLRAQKLTWAGVRLQLEKATLFLDPLMNPDVWGPALKDKIIPIDSVDGDRFVLVTHRHPDHFDSQTVKRALGDSGILVCDADVAPSASAAGIKVRVASHYEPVLLGDFTATAVPAVDGYGDPQVSWVVSGGGRRIIHCGDTLWHGAWWRIGRQLGPFDAAFLPINGARFEWRKPVSDVPAVMTPEQAVGAAVVLGARLVVPIHYGVVGAEGYRELPNAEGVFIEEARKRNVNIEIVGPGEWLTWHPRTASTRP
jgi:L-ascorbate metabolism protein UlaG (beta-lactamase superfamily)